MWAGRGANGGSDHPHRAINHSPLRTGVFGSGTWRWNLNDVGHSLIVRATGAWMGLGEWGEGVLGGTELVPAGGDNNIREAYLLGSSSFDRRSHPEKERL